MSDARRRAVLLLLLALGCGERRARAVAEQTAAAFERDFVTLRESADRLVARAEELYAHLDSQDLSVDRLDVERGGQFASFDGGAYYLKKVKEGCAYYSSPGRPPDDRLRREIKAMTLLEGALIDARTSAGEESYVFFGVSEPESVAVMYPFLDVAALYPPGLRLETFEWYRRGLERPGAGRWSARPFTSLSSGWVMDVSRAVVVGGAVKGVVVVNLPLIALCRRELKARKESVLLIASDLTVVGASPSGRKALPVPMLEDPDYLRQTKENLFATARYRLTDPSQEAGVQELGRRISAGERDIRVTVGGRLRAFVVRPVPEVGFWVVAPVE